MSTNSQALARRIGKLEGSAKSSAGLIFAVATTMTEAQQLVDQERLRRGLDCHQIVPTIIVTGVPRREP